MRVFVDFEAIIVHLFEVQSLSIDSFATYSSFNIPEWWVTWLILSDQTVLVTKNPCHLPGDVRKFWAVNIPELKHIIDCIVFPQKGKRPHSNEMAGKILLSLRLVFIVRIIILNLKNIEISKLFTAYCDAIKSQSLSQLDFTHIYLLQSFFFIIISIKHLFIKPLYPVRYVGQLGWVV